MAAEEETSMRAKTIFVGLVAALALTLPGLLLLLVLALALTLALLLALTLLLSGLLALLLALVLSLTLLLSLLVVLLQHGLQACSQLACRIEGLLNLLPLLRLPRLLSRLIQGVLNISQLRCDFCLALAGEFISPILKARV